MCNCTPVVLLVFSFFLQLNIGKHQNVSIAKIECNFYALISKGSGCHVEFLLSVCLLYISRLDNYVLWAHFDYFFPQKCVIVMVDDRNENKSRVIFKMFLFMLITLHLF
jgi:hypothetical protein